MKRLILIISIVLVAGISLQAQDRPSKYKSIKKTTEKKEKREVKENRSSKNVKSVKQRGAQQKAVKSNRSDSRQKSQRIDRKRVDRLKCMHFCNRRHGSLRTDAYLRPDAFSRNP